MAGDNTEVAIPLDTFQTLDRSYSPQDFMSSSVGQVPIAESEPPMDTAANSSLFRPRVKTMLRTLSETKHHPPHHTTYHGTIDAENAQNILRSFKATNCYLTRFSSNFQCYVVTVLNDKGIASDIKIEIDTEKEKGFSLDGSGETFSSIDGLLHHFERNSLGPDLPSLGSPCHTNGPTQRPESIPESPQEGASQSHDNQGGLVDEIHQLRREVESLQEELRQQQQQSLTIKDNLNELSQRNQQQHSYGCSIL